jgi:formylglycine-generating enzyme required for sulfatase activity
MQTTIIAVLPMLVLAIAVSPVEAKVCPKDSVEVGAVCMDKYEASIWTIPATNPNGGSNAGLIRKVQKGKATEQNLLDGGATQHPDPAVTAPCARNGSDCKGVIYAASLPNVIPSRSVTWFEALMACGNSLKQLPTNAQWQMAVMGTPVPDTDNGTTDCYVGYSSFTPIPTGSRSSCVSSWGAYDMVGNVIEWTDQWSARESLCISGGWSGDGGPYGTDYMCLRGADSDSTGVPNQPSALIRGGRFTSGDATGSGLFAVSADIPLAGGVGHVGFRCAR